MIGVADAFAPSYRQARVRFLEAAATAGAAIASYPHPLNGRDGEDLALDVAFDGSPQCERVLIVTDDAQTRQAARNVPWATVMPVAGLNAYDILRHERLVIDAVALEPAQDEAAQGEAEQ